MGEAWEVAGKPGSESHDEIFWSEERGWHRETNRAGGVEGGMSNGEPLFVRAALKPISTLTKPLRSVDTETKEPAEALRERTDSTVVPAAAVVGEAMTALVLARCYREKFGGDHIDDALGALAAYRERIGWRRVEGQDAGPTAPVARRPAIVFIGFMGAGKTAAANAARAAGLEAIEADELLEGELGMPIARFFGRRGEEEFRSLESAQVSQLLEDADGGVIALGGGAVCSERVRGALASPRRRLAPGVGRGGMAAGGGKRSASGAGPRPLRGPARRAPADLRGARRRDPPSRGRADGGAGAALADRAPRAPARNADGLGVERVG